MSLQQTAVGDVLPVTGLATGYKSGALYNFGDPASAAGNGFWGIIQDDIIGTSDALTTIDGRPILDNDVSSVGNGKGDLKITGVHTMVVASGMAQAGTGFKIGNPVYASGVSTRAAAPNTAAQRGASDPTDFGFIQPVSTFTTYGTVGGLSLVGHVWKQVYLDQRSSSKTKGAWVAEVKLLGHPIVGLI